MAYVPPHKRHPKSGDAASCPPSPAPPPGSLVSRYQGKQIIKSGIVFAPDCITKWFVVGLEDDSIMLSTFARLQPVATESFERKSLALVLKENGEEARWFSANPWVFVAETVKQDFLLSLQKVKDLTKGYEVGVIKSYLAVRFGKVLFNGNHSFSSEFTEGTLRRLGRFFYTKVPALFMQHISNVIVPEMGLKFVHAKAIYQLQLSDNTQPGSTILCKFAVEKDTNCLQLLKIEVKPMRHWVADMSCLDKNLDMRLVLLTKNKSLAATDEVLENVKSLISRATLDPETKGVLRWPLGKRSLDRYTVVAVWHSTSRTFENSSLKLKVRVADLRNSEGEVARGVSFYMPKIVSQLGEETLDTDLAFEMLKENLELIWKQCLL